MKEGWTGVSEKACSLSQEVNDRSFTFSIGDRDAHTP